MTFTELWLEVTAVIEPGTWIQNWTAAKGFLDDEFRVVSVSSVCLEIDSQNAETLQRVSEKDLEIMWAHLSTSTNLDGIRR